MLNTTSYFDVLQMMYKDLETSATNGNIMMLRTFPYNCFIVGNGQRFLVDVGQHPDVDVRVLWVEVIACG